MPQAPNPYVNEPMPQPHPTPEVAGAPQYQQTAPAPGLAPGLEAPPLPGTLAPPAAGLNPFGQPVQDQMALQVMQGAPPVPQPIDPNQAQQVASPAVDVAGGAPSAGGTGGTLHIAVHDWASDQEGQLRVQRGQLFYISCEAAHGWVYGAVRGNGVDLSSQTIAEGWVPKSVAKRVTLCRTICDWVAEGSGTLDLKKGEWIAVSREADRGWVYGERVGPRPAELMQTTDGWVPKQVLEYAQF